MRSDDTLFVLRTLGFSALAGIRSISPPALLSWYLSRGQNANHNQYAQQLSSPTVRAAITTLAVGEMIADKFPNAPDRVFAPALVFRVFASGGVTALLWSMHKRSPLIGGILGAATSIAATYATFNLRLWMGRTLPIPNALSWSGLVEDVVLWASGWLLLTSSDTSKENE